VKEIRQILEELFKSTQGKIARVHAETQEYQSGLDSSTRQLEASQSQEEWLKIANRLLDETRQMHSNTERLTQELSKVYGELDHLRSQYHRARHESMCDPLTGVKNRRAFDMEIFNLCEQARKDKQPLSLLMVDIDHFKKINDTFGHITGDSVLRWVASMIGDSIRGRDILARYGGEEFAILLPETMLDGAESVGKNVCQRISSQKLKHSEQGQSIGKITVSVGLARFRANESVEQFIDRADEALYQAKRNGRNRLQRYDLKMDVAS
jgi:diguanylate cyclase